MDEKIKKIKEKVYVWLFLQKRQFMKNYLRNSVLAIALAFSLLIFVISMIVISKDEKIDNNNINKDIVEERKSESIKKNGTFYYILVCAFADSDGDGIGDFKGIKDNLEYLKYLGIDTIVLSPVYTARTYHGYDADNYSLVNEKYIVDNYTIDNLIMDCEKEKINVMTEMIINYTSTNNKWFEKASEECIESESGLYRTYYNMSLDNFKFLSNKPITHELEGVFYESEYGDEMPDLNYKNAEVSKKIISASKYWMSKGVKGIKYDVIDTLSDDEADRTSYMKNIISEVKKKYSDGYFIIKSTDEESAHYYETGCDSIVSTAQKEELINRISSPDNYSDWLSINHTAVKSQNKQAMEMPYLSDGFSSRISESISSELLRSVAAMQILAPGNALIYYGDELGMIGNCEYMSEIRELFKYCSSHTPMYLDKGINLDATYITKRSALVKSCSTNTNILSAKEQIEDKNSLLNYYKKLISIKNKYPETYTGDVTSITTNSNGIICYSIKGKSQKYIIVHNVSNADVKMQFAGLSAVLEDGAWISESGKEVTYGVNVLSMPAYSSAVLVTDIQDTEIICVVNKIITDYFVMFNSGTKLAMSNVGDNTYTKEVDLNSQDVFEISNNLSKYGYSIMIDDGEYSSFEKSEDGKIKVNKSGKYSIIFSENESKILIKAGSITEAEINDFIKSLKGTSEYYVFGWMTNREILEENKLKYNSTQDIYQVDILVPRSGKFKIIDRMKSQIYGYGYVEVNSRLLCTKVPIDDDIYIEQGTYTITFNNNSKLISIVQIAAN